MESAAPQQRAWTGDDAPSLAFTSFVSFYEETFAPMVRLAVLLTGAPSMAEDLVHDSYARVYSHWSRVREPRAYLRRAVINACRSAQRRAVRQRRLAARHTAEHARLDADELFDVLSDLPYRQRAAIVLKYYEGRSNPEIAELLGCRVGTVASLVHRGTEQLRRVIQP